MWPHQNIDISGCWINSTKRTCCYALWKCMAGVQRAGPQASLVLVHPGSTGNTSWIRTNTQSSKVPYPIDLEILSVNWVVTFMNFNTYWIESTTVRTGMLPFSHWKIGISGIHPNSAMLEPRMCTSPTSFLGCTRHLRSFGVSLFHISVIENLQDGEWPSTLSGLCHPQQKRTWTTCTPVTCLKGRHAGNVFRNRGKRLKLNGSADHQRQR